MAKKIRPLRAWATTVIGGSQVIPSTVRFTRAGAIRAHCSLGPGDDYKSAWATWQRNGCRVLRVTITPETSSYAD